MSSLKASSALLTALCARWHGQPEMKILSFFWRDLEVTELFFPAVVLVWSTLRLTQFSHEMPYLWNRRKNKWCRGTTFTRFNHVSREIASYNLRTADVKNLDANRVHQDSSQAFYACFIWLIDSNWERVSLAMFYRIIEAMCCKWFIDDNSCFGATWFTAPSNFTVRKKQGTKVVTCGRWKVVLQ